MKHGNIAAIKFIEHRVTKYVRRMDKVHAQYMQLASATATEIAADIDHEVEIRNQKV